MPVSHDMGFPPRLTCRVSGHPHEAPEAFLWRPVCGWQGGGKSVKVGEVSGKLIKSLDSRFNERGAMTALNP